MEFFFKLECVLCMYGGFLFCGRPTTNKKFLKFINFDFEGPPRAKDRAVLLNRMYAYQCP